MKKNNYTCSRVRASMVMPMFVVGLLIWPAEVRSASQDLIDSGLTWLAGNQNPNASWGNDDLTSFRDTTTVLDTLYLLDIQDASYINGLAWINSGAFFNVAFDEGFRTSFNTDYFSRKIVTLAVSRSDVTADLSTLLSFQNSDGGWGIDDRFQSEPIDTALGVFALARAGNTDQNVISRAINYLVVHQSTDGGWSFVSGGASNAFVTSLVMQALETQVQTTAIANVLSRATAYLLSQQLSDGSWGNVPDSALAFLAIVRGTGNVEVRSAAVRYLESQHQANGSWEDDPYSTALALQALL